MFKNRLKSLKEYIRKKKVRCGIVKAFLRPYKIKLRSQLGSKVHEDDIEIILIANVSGSDNHLKLVWCRWHFHLQLSWFSEGEIFTRILGVGDCTIAWMLQVVW